MSKQRKHRSAAQRNAEHQQLLARRAERLAAEQTAQEDSHARAPEEDSARDTSGQPAQKADAQPAPDSSDEDTLEAVLKSALEGAQKNRLAAQDQDDTPFELPVAPAGYVEDTSADEEEEARRAYEEGRLDTNHARSSFQPVADDSGELPDWRIVTEQVRRSQAEKAQKAQAAPAARSARQLAAQLDPDRMDREAKESALSDIDRAAAAFAPKRKKKKSPVRAMAIFAGVLAVVFAVLTGASLILYSRYNPEKFVQSVIDSLADGGASLSTLAVSDTLNTLNADTLAPLADYFSDENARQALAEQLSDQVVDPALSGESFPALGVEKTPVFLGYSEYHLRIDAVELVVTSSAQNLILTLNDQPATGKTTAEGVLYTGLVPGRYTAQVSAVDATGQPVTGEVTSLDLLDSSAPATFSGALPIGDLTITGCTNDEAVISVNGVQVSQKAKDGVVKLQQISLNSTISFTYTQDWGAVTTGSVTFSDPEVTDLTFGNIATTGGIPASGDVDLLLSAYYASYLNGRNSHDASQLAGLTDTWREQVSQQFSAESSSQRVYTYTNAVCLPASLTLHAEGEPPAFWTTAAVAYTYSEGSVTSLPGVIYQAVEFVYQNGGWLVNRAVDIDEASFTAGNTSALQTAAQSASGASSASSGASSGAASSSSAA